MASIPLTAWAVSDATLSLSDWGKIGSHGSAGTSSLLVGLGNSSHSYGIISGYGCMSYCSFTTVVGKWNRNTGSSEELFIVGMGTSSDKKNALEVVGNSGIVRVPVRQGDVAMGVYTPPPPGPLP